MTPLRSLFALATLTAACATPSATPNAGGADATLLPPAPGDGVLQAGLEGPFVLAGGSGNAVLSVLVRPPESPGGGRAPVAMALVLDTSGSMAGLKIEHARAAARAIVEHLGEDDEVAVVAFSNDAQMITSLTAATAERRAAAARAIRGVDATGSTALYAGLVLGLQALDGAQSPVRRLVLLSDGQANIGPSTAEEIIAALPPTRAPVTRSTLGLGTDYDEAIMSALARSGEGTFYHLTDAAQLAGILEEELRSARAVAGREAVLTLKPGPGVTVLDSVGVPLERAADGTVRVSLGVVYAGETRSVSLPVVVPTRGAEQQAFGEVTLRYRPQEGAAPVERAAAVRYVLTDSPERVVAGEVPRFMVAADRMRVAHVLIDAAALLKEGDLLEAQAIMRDERARLSKRQGRLDGAARDEVDALIEMFRDPYVDAEVSAPSAPAAARPAIDLNAVVEAVRQDRPVDDAALAALDADGLRVVRNAAYARHGYRFKSPELGAWFGRTGWYRPDAAFDPGRLTPQDVRTITRVKAFEGSNQLMRARPAAPPRPGPAPDLDALIERAARGEALADADLRPLDLKQLRIVRNAAYARHGYAFRSGDLRPVFDARGWYRVDPSYAPDRLTPTDVENIRRVRALEQALVFAGGREPLRDFQLLNQSRAQKILR